MIVRRIRLHPFAGASDREVALKPGLNVILGENDIGKSTLFRALEAVLFVPVALKMNTAEGKQFRERSFPIGGGDLVRITLDFESGGRRYRLEKSWGSQPSCLLTLPDGSQLGAQDSVDSALASLLPGTQATFRRLMLARQGELLNTIEELGQAQGTLDQLGDLLRVALSQVGGISVERLKSRLEERTEAHFLNWDRLLGRPAKGRETDNEWKQQGTLLRAYYLKERLRKRFVEIDSLERQLATLTLALGKRSAARDEARGFVAKYGPVIEADSQRQAIEARALGIRRMGEELQRDYAAWTQAELLSQSLQPELERLGAELSRLNEELASAIAQSGRSELLARSERARAKAQELASARATLDAALAISQDDARNLARFERELGLLQAQLDGKKLRLSLVSGRDVDVSLALGAGAEEPRKLAPGQCFETGASGRLRLRVGDLEITVVSGDGDVEAIEERIRNGTAVVAAALNRTGASSSADAQERFEKHRQAQESVKRLEGELAAICGVESLEALSARAAQAAELQSARPITSVQEDVHTRQRLVGSRQSELKSARELLEQLKRKYSATEPSELIERIGASSADRKRLEAELASLPALPPEVGEPGEFRRRFQKHRDSLAGLEDEILRLSGERIRIQAAMPDQSVQDIQRQEREAKARFERELEQGQALLRIRECIEGLEARNEDVYSGLRGHFEELVHSVTGEKYSRPVMEGALPRSFVREDGVVVPFAFLSSGMKDGVALCLRLTMARYFLQNAGGCILLDDPFVQMDSRRRSRTVEVLKRFSSDTQVLLFTCHETSALELGGHQVEIQARSPG